MDEVIRSDLKESFGSAWKSFTALNPCNNIKQMLKKYDDDDLICQ